MKDLEAYAAFLTARWDEIEAVAEDACVETPDWFVDGPAVESGKHWVYATGEKFRHRAVADHIAAQDPRTVLNDIASKRTIVARALEAAALARFFADARVPDPASEGYLEAYALVLFSLAVPFRDHPDHPERQGSW